VKWWGTFFLSAATLILETAAIRVFALAQGYHFAFMTISIALLGLGAGGAFLAVWPRSELGPRDPQIRERRRRARADLWSPWGRGADTWLVLASLGFVVTTVAGYWVSNRVPLDLYRIAWERVQIPYLLAYYLLLVLPFFCSGTAVGLLLGTSEAGNVIYAANLTGSAGGCLVALAALSTLGGPGTVALSAGGGCIAGALFAWHGRMRRRVAIAAACVLCMLLPLGIASNAPAWFEVRLSPYHALSYALQFPGARVLFSRWNAFSRVDVVASDAIHVSPGLSLGYAGTIPGQQGLFVDAQAQAPILEDDPASLRAWADHLPLSLAYVLRPQANALVLEPGGGLDVTVARSLGARHVTAVSSNALAIEAVRQVGSSIYAGPDVSVVTRSPRSFVRSVRGGEERGFAVVDVALNDAQRTVVSGAYALGEDYRYTLEAFADYLALLEPDGVLVVQRWLQTPPSESLRAWALAVEAMERRGYRPQDSLIAIRSWSTMLILAKSGAWSTVELAHVRQFCAERQFDLVYLPGMLQEEANRYNVYEGAPYYHAFRALLLADPRGPAYGKYTFDVRPPTDDRPFFFHLFRWRQVPEIWRTLGHTWQPFGGAGYLILLALLGIAALTSTVLILVPAAFARRPSRATGKLSPVTALAYFGCLGVAYLAIEIPLVQRFVLFVDHPTIAFAVVVSVLLLASGAGSLCAPRVPARWAIPLLVAYVLILLFLFPLISDRMLGYALIARIAVCSVLLAPLGFLMGIPFPTGLALLQKRAPALVPWAWSVNGCTSVIASVLAALVALSWGFSVVLSVAVGAYLLAWGLFRVLGRPGLA
jgi:hypothetical protein